MAEDLAEIVAATTPKDVLSTLLSETGKDGFQEHLDDDHSATFLARGPKLMVSFEPYEETLRQAENGLPLGMDFVEDKNWSLLHFSTSADTWFRSQNMYDFVDELVDDCFFEEFEQVLFYGAGMGAYAACAYSVAAPGATVMAISPQATLDCERAGWDMRFPDAKRLKFDDRYGYAPDMLEGAEHAYILFDPFRALDHVHASLFQGPNVTRLKCRHLDGLIELALREMDLLHRTVEMAADGSFTEQKFFGFLRARRNHARYLRTLLRALEQRNKPLRSALLCKYVLQQRKAPIFRKRLTAAIDILRLKGDLPDWLEPEKTF